MLLREAYRRQPGGWGWAERETVWNTYDLLRFSDGNDTACKFLTCGKLAQESFRDIGFGFGILESPLPCSGGTLPK